VTWKMKIDSVSSLRRLLVRGMKIEATVFEQSRCGLHMNNIKAVTDFCQAELASGK
jgi:hypothetical protein